MDDRHNLTSYLDDFSTMVKRRWSDSAAHLLETFDPLNPDTPSAPLAALVDEGEHNCMATYLVALADLADSLNQPADIDAAVCDRITQAIVDVRATLTHEDYALFLVFATVRFYDLIEYVVAAKDEDMATVADRIATLEELSERLGTPMGVLGQLAAAAGISDEDNVALLTDCCERCDAVFSTGAAVAVALAENLQSPNDLSPLALDQWLGFPRDVEDCARDGMVDYGEHQLSKLIKAHDGLTEHVRTIVATNARRAS